MRYEARFLRQEGAAAVPPALRRGPLVAPAGPVSAELIAPEETTR